MALAKGPNVVFEGSLVLEIGPASTIPKFATVLLMGSPIPLDCKGFATFPTHEGLDAMLPLEVGLEGPKVLQGFCPWVVDVILAPLGTTIAWKP